MKLPVSLAAIAILALATPELHAATKAPEKAHATHRISRVSATVRGHVKADDSDARPRKAKKKLTTASARRIEKKVCLHPAVEFLRGTEEDAFSLTTCDGKPAEGAIEHLSVMARAGAAAKPKGLKSASARVVVASEKSEHAEKRERSEKAEKPSELLAPGIKRLDPKLLERLQAIVSHFGKKTHGLKVDVVSGYRPNSVGSFHISGRALDFRVEGVRNEELVAFCKTLPDSGCGYYPNSTFVHMDVRDPGTGHISWIDASGPGEKPHYVSSWPPPASEMVDGAGEDTADADADEDAEPKADPSDKGDDDGQKGASQKALHRASASSVLPALPKVDPKEIGALVGDTHVKAEKELDQEPPVGEGEPEAAEKRDEAKRDEAGAKGHKKEKRSAAKDKDG